MPSNNSAAFEPSGSTGTFRLTRTGYTAGALDVFVQTGGTAAEGSDYGTIAKPVTFGPGATEALVNVSPISDTNDEDDETVTLQLLADQPPAGASARYTFDAAAATGTVTISMALNSQ